MRFVVPTSEYAFRSLGRDERSGDAVILASARPLLTVLGVGSVTTLVALRFLLPVACGGTDWSDVGGRSPEPGSLLFYESLIDSVDTCFGVLS
jgi:hypothetical protein